MQYSLRILWKSSTLLTGSREIQGNANLSGGTFQLKCLEPGKLVRNCRQVLEMLIKLDFIKCYQPNSVSQQKPVVQKSFWINVCCFFFFFFLVFMFDPFFSSLLLLLFYTQKMCSSFTFVAEPRVSTLLLVNKNQVTLLASLERN